MSRSPEEYLRHIFDEANYLIGASANLEQDKFLKDETLQKAFVRSLEIIGEAVKNLPHEFTIKHREIDWRSIAGMRDRLIHGYFGVDYELVWDVVKTEIPKLRQQVENLTGQQTE